MTNRRTVLVPTLIGMLLLLVPLVRDFHIESALLAAVTGALWGGWSAAALREPVAAEWRRPLKIVAILYLAGLPLLLFAIWSGCFTVHGFGFWVFVPAPSVFFGYALGRLLRRWRVPAAKYLTLLLLLIVAVGGLLYEFMTLPQLYFFNHIWGYWAGPIYDETVLFPLAMVGFRFLTICWILLFWYLPEIFRDSAGRWIVVLAAAGLLTGYLQLNRTGIVMPDRQLQEQLGGVYSTPHAAIYYDRDSYSDWEIERLAAETEFHIQTIKQALSADRPDSMSRVELYLYRDPWQKKALVGAKYTSYVTVWRKVPQVHIARAQLAGSIRHELVHAVTALEPWPGLVPNIGLTEGVAVALDPDISDRSTIDQLVAAAEPYPSVDEMRTALSYWGFYTARSSVTYTTMGSFVRYLLETRPPDRFLEAYRSGCLEEGYTATLSQLVSGWHARLDSVRTDSSDRRRAGEIFSRPSLFEQRCPHKVSERAGLLDRFRRHAARRDTGAALAALADLKQLDAPDSDPALLWMVWSLRAGQPRTVVEQAGKSSSRIESHLLVADAHRMLGNRGEAGRRLRRALSLAAAQSDTTVQEALAIRMDSLQWEQDLRLRYDRSVPGASLFQQLYYRLKMQAVGNAIGALPDRASLLQRYAELLEPLPVNTLYLERYLSMIHHLAYLGYEDLANRWIEKLSLADLSLRDREKLELQKEWVTFLANS